MAPRKSTSKASRASMRLAEAAQPTASTSKVTLDLIPPAHLPVSLTPDYVPHHELAPALTEPQREQLVHELIGFHPRLLCDDIANVAEDIIHRTVDGIEGWATQMAAGKGPDVEREVSIGSHALETLFESHIDKAFDKFTAYALRNPFNVPADVETVLPWHRSLDFARGAHVAGLPNGEQTLSESLEDLRAKVERARLVSQRLEQAEKKLDRRLEVARQRKAQVGFVRESVQAARLHPLPARAEGITDALTHLHALVSGMDMPSSVPASLSPAQGTQAWELGRQAYLNWAVGKMLHPTGTAGISYGDGHLAEAENSMESQGGAEGMKRLSRLVGAT